MPDWPEIFLPISAITDSMLPPQDSPRAMWITQVSTDLCKFAHKISSRVTGSYAVHSHAFYEMVYIISGQVDFYIGGHAYSLDGGGTLLTFPPGVTHGVMVRSDAPYERFTVHFDPKALSMERRMTLLNVLPKDLLGVVTREQGEGAIWRNMEHSGVIQILEAMETLRNMEKSAQAMLVPIYLEALLAALFPRLRQPLPVYNREGAGKQSMQAQQIVSWVDQHYTEQVTLEVLAEKFYLSKGYLSALFRQATGSSVKDYVRSRRMTHVQMLLSAGVPAAQAAVRVGFGDYTTFYRAYVRAFGHAPSAEGQEKTKDELLARALSLRMDERSTEDDDPSMLGAVQAEEQIGS